MDDNLVATEPATAPVDRSPHGERGASMVEYAFLVALIAMACLLAVQVLGGNVDGSLSKSGTSIVEAGD